MKIVSYEEARQSRRVLALGAFDGVHTAHRQVLECARTLAARLGATPGVLTFRTDPSDLLGARQPLLTVGEEKEALLAAADMEELIYLAFTPARRDQSAEAFLSELAARLTPAGLCCGYNFHFGRAAAGDAALLAAFGRRHGIEVVCQPEIGAGGAPVSATAIRALLRAGRVEEANRLLGYAFFLRGPVISGRHLGHVLGTPTINQAFPAGKLVPKYGVYAAQAQIGGKWYPGVANIGVKPTVGSDAPLCETYILDFSGDLYGKMVTVRLLHFLREERRFADLDELKAQIAADVAAVRAGNLE